jgi:hypothetical protein
MSSGDALVALINDVLGELALAVLEELSRASKMSGTLKMLHGHAVALSRKHTVVRAFGGLVWNQERGRYAY